MAHEIYRVLSFEIVAQCTLRIKFDDESCQTINFSPVLFGDVYGPLADPSIFNQVSIDPEVHTLVWPNGADFDPATLHNWSTHEKELSERARKWALSNVS